MKKVVVVGAGPAGLMAAETLSAGGVAVHLFDAMPTAGRKFLLAGIGGLNLTHSEPPALFSSRYGSRQPDLERSLQCMPGARVRIWADGLGVPTFVGTSGRVFPKDMKAAPLLRAWLHRLRHPDVGEPVKFHMRHRWTGWADTNGAAPALRFDAPAGPIQVRADAVVLALGGGSWSRLGSDGAWVPLLQERGVAVAPLVPANCGFDVSNGWSLHFSQRFAGQPFKSVAIRLAGSPQGPVFERKGEFVATASGVEGSLIYSASQWLREDIAATGSATLTLDLLPAFSAARVLQEVAHPRGSRSLSSHLKSRLGLEGIKAGILHELLDKEALHNPARLAQAIKALPLTLVATRPLDEAISSAGGIRFEAMDGHGMLVALPGVFCAGEMLDWEAPTGGYLLTACLATGRTAGLGALAYLVNGVR